MTEHSISVSEIDRVHRKRRPEAHKVITRPAPHQFPELMATPLKRQHDWAWAVERDIKLVRPQDGD